MAKKQWVTLCQEYTNNPFTQQIISDASSTSEDDEQHSIPYQKKIPKLEPSTSASILSLRVDCRHRVSSVGSSTQSSTSGGSIESPIVRLRYVELNHVSPEMGSQRTYNRLPSPVIEKRHIRIKKKHKSNQDCAKSPDLFCDAELARHIEEASKVKKDLFNGLESNKLPTTIPDSIATQIVIEPFESQFGSVVEPTKVKYSESVSFDAKKRKKRYKKGTIAYQLQRALQIKKSRIKIWHHEHRKGVPKQEEGIRFKCLKIWTEYKVKLLECEDGEQKKFIVNLGVSQILDTEYKVGSWYEMYAPYNVGSIKYGWEDYVPYYYNVFKIIRSHIT